MRQPPDPTACLGRERSATHVVQRGVVHGDHAHPGTRLYRHIAHGHPPFERHGAYDLTTEFIETLRSATSKHGVILIADEVQSGMGRCGQFFAVKAHGITPDIITSATMATEPSLKGAWLQPGQHVDLIGAYRPDMREADDETLQRARVFVDSFDTTVGHIGEIKIPLETGAISRDHLVADYYDLAAFKRRSPDEITLFKNGGGAHLDLMTSRYILDAWRAAE